MLTNAGTHIQSRGLKSSKNIFSVLYKGHVSCIVRHYCFNAFVGKSVAIVSATIIQANQK